MIRSLTVENLALISFSELTLGPGFTAIAGETGAGKSLLIDSLELALGGRADSCLVRQGESMAAVNLAVDISGNAAALDVCAQLGIPVEDGEVVVRREVLCGGRSNVRVNGRPVTVGMLRTLGPTLAGLHIQGETRVLSDPASQLALLDEWIGGPATDLRARFEIQLRVVEDIRNRLQKLVRTDRERAQRIDLLQFQVAEIAEAGIRPGETGELKAMLSKLQHAQRLGDTFSVLLESLDGCEGSAAERLSGAVRDISASSEFDPGLMPILELVETASAAVLEATGMIRRYIDSLECDPEAVESAASRLDNLNRLRRKYGETDEDVVAYFDQVQAELRALLEDSTDLESLQAELSREEDDLQSLADSLTLVRKQHASAFSIRVQGHIRELAMPSAEFAVSLDRCEITASGQDMAEFQFSANPGEPKLPLNKVASGGELSRVMLAVKAAGSGAAGGQTLVFDEIDAGLSGRAAAAMARKLRELAQSNQVVVVTHLPQVAAAADSLVEIVKTSGKLGTQSSLAVLGDDAKPAAIARLLAGEKVGERSLANARELIEAARPPSQNLVLTG
ncbi:MAG: DNA repair protein RecN [Armatimonadetes bacterium]|nr:DNA repair protein RecN [Armatimonadota bacterium]MBX3107868.1 DNA repair protein RecN [Fimbriimonadaceae bacterium]